MGYHSKTILVSETVFAVFLEYFYQNAVNVFKSMLTITLL